MITYTATEIRQNVNVPFTYSHPLYSAGIQQSYQLYTNAGIDVTVTVSEDNLVQTITHTCTDDKEGLFTTIHEQVVTAVESLYQNTDKDLPFARSTGVETTQYQSFDADHKHLEAVFATHYKLR